MLPLSLLVALFACGESNGKVNLCQDFVSPERSAPTGCQGVDAEEPLALVECAQGSGHLGRWTVDGDGLPAFDFGVEHRCDDATEAWAPHPSAERDPVHVVGNGRGMVAMAHASGAVEIYTQERGHKWLNKVDTWSDPDDPSYPLQIGGGFNYLVVDDRVLSTRYDDHSVGEALEKQTRRFGVGYYETVTTFEDLQLRVTRRVYAPDTHARALVAEVTLENLSNTYKQVGLVEFWDLNLHQLAQVPGADELGPTELAEERLRYRRGLSRDFTQRVSYDKENRSAVVSSRVDDVPEGVTDRMSKAKVDYFPEPVFLAPIDAAERPDAVWLADAELWGQGKDAAPPPGASREGNDQSRSFELEGEDQSALLAMRLRVSVPTDNPVTRRFAVGYLPEGSVLENVLAELRGKSGELRALALESWRDRMAWVAVPGAKNAGIVQRELAWSSYYAQAQATFDELHALRILGKGGAERYVAGVEGSMGDLALIADGLTFLDAELARATLLYALAAQHGSEAAMPGHFARGTTGVGDIADAGEDLPRSDTYFLLPSAVARYVASTRDFEFLRAKAGYWPLDVEEQGAVLDHLSRTLEYVTDGLGLGARGLVAMRGRDYDDGVTSLSGTMAQAEEASSAYNTGLVVHGFPLLVELLADSETDLAAAYRDFLNAQADALQNQAFNGEYYERGFTGGGEPMAPGFFFLGPQLFPILAGMVDEERRNSLLDRIESVLESDLGAVSMAALDSGSGGSSGHVLPALNVWLTEAYSLRDRDEAWESLLRNTLASHASTFPGLWYGIWSGPSFVRGLAGDRPGETGEAAASFPVLSTHAHLSPLRALVALLGIHMGVDSWEISPRLPVETFAIVLPRFELHSRPDAIRGVITSSGDDELTLTVRLPSGAQDAGLVVKVKGSAVDWTLLDNEHVRFQVPLRRDDAVEWSVVAL